MQQSCCYKRIAHNMAASQSSAAASAGKVAGIFNLGGQNKCLGSTRAHLLHLLVRKHRAPAPQERPGAGTRECTPEPSKNLNFEWHGPILNDFLAPLEHSKLEPLAVKRPASCPRTSGKLTCASRFHFLFSGTVDVFKATAQVSSFGFLAFENHSPSNQQPANPLTNGNSLLHHVIAEGVPLAAALRMPHCDRGAWPRPTSRTKPWAW